MRRIIMFKGGVETQEFFSFEIARALKMPWLFSNKEYEVFWFDLLLQEESTKNLREYYKQNKADSFFAFTFNFNGIAGEEGLYYQNGNFWDDTGIPVINMVVDHPLYYQKYEATIPKRYVQISIDGNHEKYLHRFYPDITSGGFIPLGGTQLNYDYKIMPDQKYFKIKQRPIDVVFTGNYTPLKTLRKYIEEMDKEYIDFYESILDEVKNSPDLLVENVAEKRLIDELGQLTDEQIKICMPNMMYVDLAVRFYYRGLVVAALADNGIKVHTFGAGWDRLECRHPENIIQAGSVDSLKCLEVISQSKISLNVMPWFKAGAHDRIFNTMLNGAVSLTDSSSYINTEFKDGENLVIYSLKNIKESPKIISEKVTELLGNENKMQEIADEGYKSCYKTHTWIERTKDIVRIMDSI